MSRIKSVKDGIEYSDKSQREKMEKVLAFHASAEGVGLSELEIARRCDVTHVALRRWNRLPWWRGEVEKRAAGNIQVIRKANQASQGVASRTRLKLLGEIKRRVDTGVEDGSIREWKDSRIVRLLEELRQVADKSEVLDELKKVSSIARELEAIRNMREMTAAARAILEKAGVDVEAELVKRGVGLFPMGGPVAAKPADDGEHAENEPSQ